MAADRAACGRRTPEEARRRIMIGGKEECLDTIERYRRVGVTHFIFMTFAPYNEDEIQALRRGGHARGARGMITPG